MATQEKILAKKRVARRTPINGGRNILTVQGKEDGYVYRIVNDTGDRIATFQELGYEVVKDTSVKVGDRRVANPTQEGSPVRVSVGGGVQGIVMRIPQEFYDEDQQSKAAFLKEQEASMKKEARSNADFGSIEIR